MPSLSRSLEQALHRAIKLASDRHHEYATLEHLLLALMDDADAAQVMKACNVNTDALRTSLVKYVDEELMTLVIEDGEDAKHKTDFTLFVQIEVEEDENACTDEVTGLTGMVALFREL
jgi:ATP-dependent Clp protease ATP-binding subunit ClpA